MPTRINWVIYARRLELCELGWDIGHGKHMLEIGRDGEGQLIVSEGGLLVSGDAVLVSESGSATARLSGFSTWRVDGDLVIGSGNPPNENPARLELTDSASVIVDDTIFVGGDSDGPRTDGVIQIGDGATIGFSTSNSSRELVLWEGGVLESESGLGLIEGSVTNRGGTVSPGNSTGVLAIDGDFVQESGTFTIKLSSLGDVPGIDHNAVFVGGEALLSGILDVDLTISSVPPNTVLAVSDFIRAERGLTLQDFALSPNDESVWALAGETLVFIPEPSSDCLVFVGFGIMAIRLHYFRPLGMDRKTARKCKISKLSSERELQSQRADRTFVGGATSS